MRGHSILPEHRGFERNANLHPFGPTRNNTISARAESIDEVNAVHGRQDSVVPSMSHDFRYNLPQYVISIILECDRLVVSLRCEW